MINLDVLLCPSTVTFTKYIPELIELTSKVSALNDVLINRFPVISNTSTYFTPFTGVCIVT